MNAFRLPVIGFALVLAAAQTAAQQATPRDTLEPLITAVVTHHAIELNGADVHYTATVGEKVLADAKGTPLATMFSTAYVREGIADPSKRPVLFAFNGGPGASSLPLHFGVLGPRRRLRHLDSTGARMMVDNAYSVLDDVDLVLVDPVGTGFSRVLPDGDGTSFWGVNGDARAMLGFIRDWLRDNGRAASPVYICGESYGGFRIATMMRDVGGLRIAGLILISPMLDASATAEVVGNDLPHIFALPSMAAAAWHHQRVNRGGRSVERVYDDAAAFAQGEYALALLKGTRLAAPERDRIAARMSAFIGLPAKAIAAADLRVNTEQFLTGLLADKGLRVGRLDARATGNAKELATKRPPMNDPSMSVTNGNDNPIDLYFHRDLHVASPREYVGLALDVNAKWNWSHDSTDDNPFYSNPTANIGAAMAKQPDMRVMLVGGYFDLATPYLAARYALDHGGVPPDRVTIAAFPGGHSMYDDESNLKQAVADIRRFLNGARAVNGRVGRGHAGGAL